MTDLTPVSRGTGKEIQRTDCKHIGASGGVKEGGGKGVGSTLIAGCHKAS